VAWNTSAVAVTARWYAPTVVSVATAALVADRMRDKARSLVAVYPTVADRTRWSRLARVAVYEKVAVTAWV
jgi:cephalosporin-C deacetylase-like acetyl esterase